MTPRTALVAVAVLAALAPIPPVWIERWYANGFYPQLQGLVTPATNVVPIALIDVAGGALLIAAIAWIVRAARQGWRQAVRSSALAAMGLASVLYLWFLILWGLNYRRVPLEEKLVFDRARVTRQAAVELGNGAILRVNRMHAPAHGLPFERAGLERAFAEVQHALGTRPAAIGTPKRSLLTLYFRRAAIDGMTDPFFLEIIVNPEVLPFERPFVLAHEWAHLAGYAAESEANFVAWLTCLGGDAMSQYSGWLSAYQHAAGALTREERAALVPLDRGPRDDLRAMAERYRRSSPAVRAAARDVYDSYLRANRVAEGIGSYDAVLRLMLGSRFDERWRPQRRAP